MHYPTNITNITLYDDYFGEYIAPLSPPSTTNLTAGTYLEVYKVYYVTEDDITPAGAYVNEANATGKYEINQTLVSALADASVGVGYNASNDVTKAAAANPSSPAVVGGWINYTYNVTNDGEVNITNLGVIDTVLGDITYLVGLTKLAPGQFKVFKVNYTISENHIVPTVPPNGVIKNVVNFTADDPANTLLSVTATRSVVLKFYETITLVKTVDPDSVICGGLVNYTYVVNNTGDVNLTNINLTDDVMGNITLNGTDTTGATPANVSYVSGDLDGDNVLDPGESWTFKVTDYYISSSVINTGNVTGIGNVTKSLHWAIDDAHVNVTHLSINGTKFEDLNGNGTRDPGEPGLDNWTIVLSYDNGTFITNTTTAVGGSYRFDLLCPGNYTVGEELKSGWNQSYPPSLNHTVNLTVTNETDINFGNYNYSCLGGNKTNDTGVRLADWNITVYMNDSGTLTEVNNTTTNLNGEWLVCGLSPGVYDVEEELKPGWRVISPADGWHRGVVLISSEVRLGIDFENSNKSCLGGNKTNDTGVRLADWNITVYMNDSGTLTEVNNTTTNLNGEWQVCDLLPGVYDVEEELKPGWRSVTPSDGWHRSITLNGNETRLGIDFENSNKSCLGGNKTNDTGVRLADWNITVYRNDSGTLTQVNNTKTNLNGEWLICNLLAGVYDVEEELKPGWRVISPADGWHRSITLNGNETRLGIDFENSNKSCLGGNKTNDTGVRLADWIINVYRNDSGMLTQVNNTKTDLNGEWLICNLLAGVYDVEEELIPGWRAVTPSDGWHRSVVLGGNEARLGIDFVNSNTSCLGGNKTNDTGVRLPDWTIEVYRNDSGILTKVDDNNTNANGEWLICGLSPGTYDVKEILKPGWEALNPSDGWHRNITLNGNETKLGIDFQNNYSAIYCIDGHKYDDTNQEPLSNWTIIVTNSTGEEVGRNTTDNNGYWKICGLIPGENYTVCEELQPGWTPINPPDGCYHNVTMVPGQNLTRDFYNDPRNLTITKVADKYEVKSGEEVTYTITVCNNGGKPVHNVTVWDVFDKYVEILWATPALGPDGRWHFDVIPAGECRTITIKIRVPERQDFEFGMEQGVAGEGFVNVANDYSTTFEAYIITNCAYATSDWNKEPISACVTVTVGEELGTELETREYGSGRFDSEERVTIFTENKSIEWEEDLSATYKPTTIGLYNNRTVTYDSAWVKKARAKNYLTGTTITETYHDAVSLDRESRMFLDKNQSVMEVNSEFDGRGHVGFLKMPSSSSTLQTTPIFEAREDYTGSFKILERVDEYGSSVSSDKSASGSGFVVVDKRVKDSQRSYESGTGAYDSEELIRTYTNYIAKDISLVHAPMNQSLTDDVSIDASMKWKEGMYSKTPETSYIGEEYTGVTELDKETVALGLNEMDTEANFSGRARYRAVLRDEVDFDEQYEGDYSIERMVLFTGVPKYDRPHLNVTKKLENITDETIIGAKETVLVGESRNKVIKVATYTIRIENDGNRALGPIYVRDIFPPVSIFINASVRPSELTDTYANWTLTHLAIGDVVVITLNLDVLDVTKYHPEELVNRVEVCGGYNGDEQVCASNFSALEDKWLSCCLDETVSATKTAEIDQVNPNVVWYRVDIKNWADVTRVATVTDSLPAGMVLLDSMVPFASYENNTVVWNVVEIGPFETVTIAYRVEVQMAGRFVNSVEVDPRSVDGPVVQPVYANSVIDVGVVEECGTSPCTGWQPPNWDFEYVGYPAELSCEELTCDENCGLAP